MAVNAAINKDVPKVLNEVDIVLVMVEVDSVSMQSVQRMIVEEDSVLNMEVENDAITMTAINQLEKKENAPSMRIQLPSLSHSTMRQ